MDRDILALHLSQISLNPLISPITGRISLPDDVQNILLFVPFGVLGMLSARASKATAGRIVLVTVLAAALSTGVEILQLFTRERITSTSDVMNNTFGGFLGALAAYRLRPLASATLRLFKRAGLLEARTFYPFLVAAAVIVIAACEPFDLTLDVSTQAPRLRALLADPWQYTGLNDEGVAVVQTALFAVALCMWLRTLRRRPMTWLAAAIGVPFVVALEGSQILIASRMPGLEDALVRAGGVLLGCGLWAVGRRTRSSAGWLTLIALATAAGAAMQMLSPFELAPERRPFQLLPFMNYYEVTTFVTLSHALELMLIYFPLGFCFGWTANGSRTRSAILPAVVSLAIAVPIEFAQGWIVGRYPDVTDPALSAIGCWIGAWTATAGAAMFARAAAAEPLLARRPPDSPRVSVSQPAE